MQTILTDIGDKKIEAMMGGAGDLTVVILPGMSSSLYEWELVLNQLNRISKFLILHRPGVGNSEIGRETRTTCTTAHDVKLLLEKQKITEPILLVGHSYGGLCAQHFAKLFPDSVAGIILVDSTSVNLHRLNQIPLTSDEDSDEQWIEKCLQYSKMTPEQLEQEIQPQIAINQRTLSPSAQREIIRCQTNPNLYKAMASEIREWESCALAIKQAGDFPELPILVIGRDPEYTIRHSDGMTKADAVAIENVWQDLIQEQVELVSKSEYIQADRAGHSIHLDRPDLIVQAIKSLLG
ncbi:alpha/beta fold hydrolase [Sporosarcina sp. Te-1]|uniref:alpha/beta fold hydrolase n=1 Tax=Sporosarcina sp. Te-1 TaxID=2818390 RepID=UPI001A9F6ECF|nr:alpha/beta hydrolase [Sporosarcina sp. Te-1]QTD42534.1 alpha/beta hydrolase [Sporosarcina sp. Te-1]